MRDVFVPLDAETILKIPLCTRQVGDFWAWSEDPRGRFSVSSTYKMMSRIKASREAWLEEGHNASNTAIEKKGWSSIWSMQVPSKLKVFTWRLAQHSLPTGDVLHHRNMASTHVCALCGVEDSWRHSLLDCTMARSVWALSKEELVEHMCANREDSAKGWLFTMSESVLSEDFTELIVTMWAIWWTRRRSIHDNEF